MGSREWGIRRRAAGGGVVTAHDLTAWARERRHYDGPDLDPRDVEDLLTLRVLAYLHGPERGLVQRLTDRAAVNVPSAGPGSARRPA